jgi:hypothetical protein
VANPAEVPCEPKTFVVQTPKLLKLSAGQFRPLAKENRYPLVASDPLHEEVTVVKRR